MPATIGTVLHSIDKYCARPQSLETKTFFQYFEDFELTKQPKKNTEMPLLRDGFGNFVSPRAPASLVRFTDFHPAL